ncbi:MAG: head GIN domain-containing protein [Flavobacteriaceae bacterium]
MKKLAILLLLISTTISFSQETINAKLGSFDEIKVFSGLKITLIKADVAEIEISGKKSSELVYKNVNGRLKLSMRFPETFNASDVEVILYYSENINMIDVNEGSVIASKEIFKQDKMELKSQEGAYIKLSIDVTYLTIRSVLGGSITVSGTVDNQDIEANTGGSYDGYFLEANSTTAVAASGATIKVNTRDLLDATVRFGGNIYYKGKTSEVIKNKVIGGTIESKD